MFVQSFIHEDELQIKDSWFIFSIICAGFAVITDVLQVLPIQRTPPPLAQVIAAQVILLFLLYHFASRKSGTRLLTFIMFVKSLGLIWPFPMEPIQSPLLLHCCLSTIDFFLLVGWIFLSLKLRKLNMAMRPFKRFSREFSR